MKSRTVRILVAILTVLLLLVILTTRRPIPDASADSLERGETRLRRTFVGITLTQPLWLEQPPGNSARWYAIEQAGRIITFPNKRDTKERAVALDITDRVKSGGEMGLLGMAFHPKFAENGFIYVNYTTTAGGDRSTRVSRFSRKADVVTFDPASEKILLAVGQPYSNHNGGQVSFGPDGLLYIALGDGGLAGDPKEHGQNTSTLLGAILRIDVDGKPGEGAKREYAIPADNPFAKGSGAPELYAWGLRNVWRFSFDKKTGELWAGDVGQNAWEEINIIEKGKNYGWNIREGTRCYRPPIHLRALGKGDCGEKITLQAPVYEYSQKDGDRSVTGGYVYRGTRSPTLQGQYIFGDYVSGRIWAFDRKSRKARLLLDTGLLISSFFQTHEGEIGVIDYVGMTYMLSEGDQRQ